MPITQSSTWKHSNRYSADTACEHCDGIVRHESWCITRSQIIRYAYQAVLDASALNAGDYISLHALGGRWVDNTCAGACKSGQATKR